VPSTLLPLDKATSINSLVVPSLHKPLIFITNLCNVSLSMVFTKNSCNIYSAKNLEMVGTLSGWGYRWGNLYYLPSGPMSPPPSSSSAVTAVFDNSLLGFHHWFSQIGLRALKSLLCEHNITLSIMNKLDVQQFPTCIQSKMHQTAFKTQSPYFSDTPGQLIHSDVGS
jgi:hypothetical protein